MERDIQLDPDSEMDDAYVTYEFSRPNIIPSPDKLFNSAIYSDNAFGGRATQSEASAFTFAKPASIERLDYHHERKSRSKSGPSAKVSRTHKSSFDPPSPFTAAKNIKNTSAFTELEKNSKKKGDGKEIKLELSNSITCLDVPEPLLVKSVAKQYFEQFGEILKITVKPKRKMIIIYYPIKAMATKAYYQSGKFLNHNFKREWTTPELLEKPKKKESVKGKIASILNLDDEIQEELEALKGLEYNLPDPENLRAITAAKAKVKRAAKVVANKDLSKRSLPLVARPALKSVLKPAITPSGNIVVKTVVKPVVKPKVAPKIDKPVLKPEVSVVNPNIYKISSAQIEELQQLVRSCGTTSEEKYKILDARDRLMRLKQSKIHSLATAKVTKGSCPDMCPERERYMREFQRQLASYEQIDSSEYKINHQIAVKQYSRSSADQEEPMAHDLRPLKSLKMSMSYLLHEIADLCEREDANLTEWYHFVWDRMRSVRKDITQQELCCAETVQLVEQCARFHILSSERLCAEEASVFDPKINSENLTKCLQTLKYMYHDLREHGVSCKNEPEFRAYVILLNLNNGTFISELSTLPQAVQHSTEVKFALDVYSAIAMDNYVKFFKLVRKTTYLNACILLRYFNQVRLKALKVMVKAYCRTSGNTEYPLYELIDILGFEDEDEVFDFCSRVGIKCDRESLYVKLNKEKFREPDNNLEQGRAYNLVLSKRLASGQSVGQCIAGGVYPEKSYENHKPHCSFDDKGYLLPSSINAQDQNLLNDPYEFNDDGDNDVQFVSEQKPPSKLLSNADEKKPVNAAVKTNVEFPFRPKPEPSAAVANSVFAPPASSGLDAASNVFAQPAAVSAPTIFAKPAPSIFSAVTTKPSVLPASSPFNMAVNKSIFSGSSQANLFKTPAPVTRPVTLKREAAANASRPVPSATASSPAGPAAVVSSSSSSPDRTALKRRMEDGKANLEKRALTEKEELQRLKEAIERKMKAEQERLALLERVRQQSLKEYEALQREVVEESCAEVARAELARLEALGGQLYEEVLSEMCEAVLRDQLFIQDALMEVESRLRDRLVLKYYRAWKQWAARRRAQRREALDNTPVWLQPDSLEQCARRLYRPEQRLAIQYARECKKRKSLSLEEEQEDEKKQQVRHAPIEFVIYVGLQENTKLLDAEPRQHNFWKMVVSWPLLENRLTLWRHKKLLNKYLSPSDYTLEPIIIKHKPSANENLDICIRYFEGLISDKCLTGMDALLFIASTDEDERLVERRLSKALLSRNKLMPIPLVVLVFGDETSSSQETRTAMIERLLESGHVSEYSILYEKSDDENVVLRIFQSATLWLAINRSPAVPLEMDYLQTIFNDCLTEELWLRIKGHLLCTPRLSKALNDPNFVINLHNEAITHITDIILDPESLIYTDFAPELKIYLNNKRSYPCTYEYFNGVWKHPEYRTELERIMNSFIFPLWSDDWPIHDPMETYDAVADYCRRIISYESSLTVMNNIMSDLFLITDDSEDSCPNFVDVLLHIMAKKISDIGGNTRVVYNKNHIKHFRSLPWWFKSSTLLDYAAQQQVDDDEEDTQRLESESQNVTAASDSLMELDFEYDLDELNETCEQQEEEQPVQEVCRETSIHVTELQSTAEQLEKQLEEQRLRSQSLKEKLMKALQDDDDDNLNFGS